MSIYCKNQQSCNYEFLSLLTVTRCKSHNFWLLPFHIWWRCRMLDLSTERSLTRENEEIFHVCTGQWAQRSDPGGNESSRFWLSLSGIKLLPEIVTRKHVPVMDSVTRIAGKLFTKTLSLKRSKAKFLRSTSGLHQAKYTLCSACHNCATTTEV